MRVSFLFILGIALVVIGALSFGLFQAARARAALMAGMDATPLPRDVSAGLPPLVRAFALRGGADASGPACGLHLRQVARIRLKKDGPFTGLTARQRISSGAPGFVWMARQRRGPFTLMRVSDSFVAGQGGLQVWLLGMIRVANATGPDVTRAEAMRYLAELPWAPDAILGNPELHWQMVAPDRARVSLRVKGQDVSVDLLFDEHGDIASAEAKDRPATEDGLTVLRDWRGIFSDYRQIGPRRVPGEAEVGYVYPDGYQAYYQGTVTDLRAEAC